jgi:hypothetical protein
MISFRFQRILTIRVAFAVVLLGLAMANARAQSATAPRADNQVWTDVQLAVPLNDKTDLVLLGVLRLGRDITRPVNERIGAGISTKIGKHLTLFPFYQHIASQPIATNHSTEERITLEATAKFPIKHFTLSDRNRLEFHFRSPPLHFTQYRNRLHLEHPLKINRFELEGFIADEVFYDSIASAWIRNRFSIGFAKKFNRHFSLELYYLRQNDSHSHPGDINALGNAFKFRL